MESDSDHISESEAVWLPVSAAGRLDSDASGGNRLDLWALVLEARYVPYRLEFLDAERHLLVPKEFFDRAITELCLFEEENRNWPPPPPSARPQHDNILSTLSILLLLAIFHNLTLLGISLPGHADIDWSAAGSARSADIVHGDWWRAVTALTLHAGVVHLASNLLIGGGIMVLLCREIGSGCAWSLTLGSGILGKLANASVQLPTHVSVGASTAVFGAIGILSALSLIRYRHLSRRWLLPIAAGLSLLALLGTEGDHTDLGAHFFGFLWGIAFGVAAGFAIDRLGRWKPILNAMLALSSAALVVTAWWLALACA